MLAIPLEVLDEIARQNKRWGEQNHPDGTGGSISEYHSKVFRVRCDIAVKRGDVTWKHILQEEVYEALAESDPKLLKEELIQVAAVAIQWCRAIERRMTNAELESERREGNVDPSVYKRPKPKKAKKKPRKRKRK